MTAAQVFTPPYPPSWVDRFIGWINRLPVPVWLAYTALTIILFVALNGVIWLFGLLPIGQFDLPHTLGAVFWVGIIAWIDYMHRIARQAVEQFKPALGVDERTFESFKYRITHIPPVPALVVTLLNLASSPIITPLFFTREMNAQELLVYSITNGVVFSLTLLLLGEIARQLIWVGRIHAAASHIDLYDRVPLYAFSRLTTRISLFVLPAVYSNFVANPEALNTPIGIFLGGLVLLISAMCFVLPVYGMHQRMAAERVRLLTDVNRRLQIAFQKLHAGFDAENFSQVDALSKMVTGLNVEHDTLNKLSTWPWQATTVRGFSGALLLPLIVWLITRVLSRFGL